MERFFINLTSVKDREQLYDRLTAVLPLPEWCGRNLDALYDAFTGEMHDVRIFFRGASEAEEKLGGYFSMFQTMCEEACEQNLSLEIFFQ